MKNICNIAGYKFTALTDLPRLQLDLLTLAQSLDLKGTILLAPEGINIMLAGQQDAIEKFNASFRKIPAFSDLKFKTSYSEKIPFKRLRIKIKKEIITFAVPVAPHQLTGQRISPILFKQWLDSNKEMLILDTRNRCEIDQGKFKNAMDLNIDHFRSFPAAIDKLAPELKQKPIVMYCTGGIRCEKASAYMLQQGYQEVYQLEGGILKYLEECGESHYSGKCFVFDERETVDKNLAKQETQ